MNDQQACAATVQAANHVCLRDAKQCKAWLAEIAVGGSLGMLEAIGDGLGHFPDSDIAPAVRIEILQVLDERITQIRKESASSYCAKALPLASAEYDLWHAIVDVRLAMAAGYEACLGEHTSDTQDSKQQEALACHNALHQSLLAIHDYARVYTATPVEIWKRIHKLYRHAEHRGITELPVRRDAPNIPGCHSTYMQALLFCAAQPSSLSPAQIDCVAEWLYRWSHLARLHTETPGGNPLTALAVDLDGADALKLLRHMQPGAGLRHLDTKCLGEKLRELMLALRQGADPESIGLGAQLTKSSIERLLTSLYVRWCSAGTARASTRSFSSSKAMVTLTIPAMHFYIGGFTFRQPGQGAIREEEEDLQVFGHLTQRTIQKFVSQRSSAFEPWSIANESVSGMFILCRQPDFRTRISHGQLLGLMKRSDKPIELVTVQRLSLLESGELEVGVRRIEGMPQAIAARIVPSTRAAGGISRESNEMYERALLLPAVPEKSLPPRLILQPGWFRPSARLDLYGNQKTTVRLLDLDEKGPNFEQVTFESANPN